MFKNEILKLIEQRRNWNFFFEGQKYSVFSGDDGILIIRDDKTRFWFKDFPTLWDGQMLKMPWSEIFISLNDVTF